MNESVQSDVISCNCSNLNFDWILTGSGVEDCDDYLSL